MSKETTVAKMLVMIVVGAAVLVGVFCMIYWMTRSNKDE